MEISVFNTFIHPEAFKTVNEVLTSTFLSEGKLVKSFEQKLKDEFGVMNAVTVNSGTTALHLALVLAGITKGDEVIIPAQTFIATGLVVLQQGAIPVFADVDYETGNISVESIKEKITRKTKAIIPVHWGGYPCDIDAINLLAKQNNLFVIEDAAHALGATYKGQKIGSISDYTCFSFQAIKHLTTGDGGAIGFLDKKNADSAIVKRWFGIDRSTAALSILGERVYNVEDLGYKYHLNDYAAALGLSNMEGFFERLKRRREIAERYFIELSNVSGLSLFNYQKDRESAFWLFGMHVEKRENFILALKSRGVVTSVIHQRIDRNSVFGGLRTDLPNQLLFDQTQIHIPLHDALTDDDVEQIVKSIEAGW